MRGDTAASAAQLVEVPLRESLNAEILKIECLVDDAKRSLSEYSRRALAFSQAGNTVCHYLVSLQNRTT